MTCLMCNAFLIPECSTLIKYSPIKPIIKGNKKLKKLGKKEVIFIEKNELSETSKNDRNIKNIPEYK